MRRRWVAGLLLVALLAGCTGGNDDRTDTTDRTATDADGNPDGTRTADVPVTVDGMPSTPGRDDAGPTSVGLRLSEGHAAEDTAEHSALVDGTPLTPDEIDAVLARLPQWSLPADDVQQFDRPADTLKPPLIGDTIDTPFPPPATPTGPPSPDAGDLHVLRYQPDGQVDVAPFLTVTFDQPMVSLTTLEQLDQSDVPVEITPGIDGRWRWIGTRTLRFEVLPGVTDRLPAATEYHVEVPAGTTAANGATLVNAVAWTFSTPAPRVTAFTAESDSLPLEPVFVAVFDQRVDPSAVLDTTTLDANGHTVALRLATPAEIDDDDQASAAVGTALPDRAVAFRASEPLPVDAALTITVGPGTPSREGPLTSTTPATYHAHTFGALRVVNTSCSYAPDCQPGVPFTIELSNPLDTDSFDAGLVAVDPEIPGMRIDVYGNVLQISGVTAGRTTYHVTLDGALRDVYGQTLGEATELTFDVGPAQPTLYGLQREWITTDPMAAAPTVSIQTVNHDDVRVQAWAVTAADLPAFRTYVDSTYSNAAPPDPPWQLVMDETVAIDNQQDRFVETAIDLTDAFAAAGTQLVVRVEPTEHYAPDNTLYWNNRPTVAWVQRTTLGVDAIADNDELLVWTTDLTTGAPVAGVTVELVGDGRTVTTDADGLARVELGSTPVVGLAASSDDRQALLPSPWFQAWTRQPTSAESRWYVFDDRGIYRPGETVRLTGWVRQLPWADDTHLQFVDDATSVGYQVMDAQGVELASGNTPLNALGGFNLAIDLPAGANLGPASVNFTLPSLGGSGATAHQFQIQEFRRPEYEVTARSESSGPYYAGRPATVAVDAEYYAGGPLPDAQVDWLVTTQQTSYQPPNWDQYTFGVWQPWWLYGDVAGRPAVDLVPPCFDCPPGDGADYKHYSGRTDASGTHYLQIDFDGPDVDLPRTVTAEATVQDVNRQAWASRTSLLVHAARYYVGLRSDRTFVEQGAPLRYDAVVTDVDGNLVAGRTITVTAGRVESKFENGNWTEELVDEQVCMLTSTTDATDASMRCEFPTTIGGTYRVTAVVADDTGHRNRTQTTTWVSGGVSAPTRGVAQDAVTIVPDRESYAPGDTAELLVQSPFAPATGLMTLIHRGIVSTQRFDTTDGSAVLDIPVDDGDIPNMVVQIDMVGATARTADDGTALPDSPTRPAYATGQITLKVPPVTRALTVTATPAADAVTPGTDTAVTVQVAGPDGAPVSGAAVAVVVVDEAVLALTGYQLSDPLDAFYADLWSTVTSTYARSSILLTRSDLLDAQHEASAEAAATTAPASAATVPASAPVADASRLSASDDSAGGAASEQQLPQIDVRDNFDALAVYAPDETTGADGRVSVDVPLPDSLTRYRVMAVAIDGAEHFGKGESTVTARLPLMVRPSAPRFLNFGDQFELPVVVQNQTDAPLDVDVVVEGSNLVFSDAGDNGATGKRVTVPANDRVEVRFPASAHQVGTARFRVSAAGADGAGSDAATVELPVYTPATTEAFATYGVIDDSTPGGAVSQPINAPAGVFPQFGGLEIGTSTTALQALTDAVLYLEDYPYDTADGYSSRIMAIASLRDVLDAFDADGLPDAATLNARMDSDIAALAALQNDDGGWSWWARGLESSPWQTVQSTHALVLARQAGYEVPDATLNAALAFLADIESHIPSDCSQQVRTALRAYAIHVRTLAGDRDVAKATAIYDEQGADLQLDAMAWLWPSIDDNSIRAEIERRFENAATETANAATFATSYGEDDYLIANSDRRTDGVILDALIGEAPGSDLIVKTVNGLLGQQTRGRWNSAQDNAFILIAMNRYFHTFESATPDLVARAWIGDTYAAEHEYRGRTTDRDNTLVPMDQLTHDTSIVVQRDGMGRLYYRLGLRYAPDDLQLDARDDGFVVDRVYEAVDDPADVTRDAAGTWHIRAGATVRVRLTMVADARRTHVALVDPLPAGLEPVNPDLAVSQTIPPPEGEPVTDAMTWCWCWRWFEHQNLRDDRAEAFTSFLEGGTYEYTYIARATTPGQFVVPPAKAEEIYSPEVFGRSASTTLVVG